MIISTSSELHNIGIDELQQKFQIYKRPKNLSGEVSEDFHRAKLTRFGELVQVNCCCSTLCKRSTEHRMEDSRPRRKKDTMCSNTIRGRSSKEALENKEGNCFFVT